MDDFRICPSILNADQSNLPNEIAKVASDAQMLHLDIMDNQFVPNKTFSLAESVDIIGSSPLPVDVHLMIREPELSAFHYAKAGAFSVTFHYEASAVPHETISSIRQAGARVGLAIKPKTSFEEIAEFLTDIDMLLVMTVEPGFGGQAFMADMIPKIHKARTIIDLMPTPRPWLQVDGGISLETIEAAAQAGADTFVAGSAVFKAPVPSAVIANMKNILSRVTLG